MWIVCWSQEYSQDRWERRNTEEALLRLFIAEKIPADDNTLVFSDEAEAACINGEQFMLSHAVDIVLAQIMYTIEKALLMAGYEVMDGERDTVIVRHSKTDQDFEINLSEFVP